MISRFSRTHLQRLALQQRYMASKAVATTGTARTGILTTWYNTFGKTTATYASWLISLILVGEYATGKITDGLWTLNNYGKTFSTTDWSKFDEFEDDEEDEEEEDEDEEEDD